MRDLLTSLSVRLSHQDIKESDTKLVESLFKRGYLTQKDGFYKLNSKYKAGILGSVQDDKAYLSIIGESSRDLLIESVSLSKASEGDIVLVQRLLTKRGAPSAKILEVLGKAQSYSVLYVVSKALKKELADLKNDFIVDLDYDLSGYQEGDLFCVDNVSSCVIKYLGNLNDPASDEGIVLAWHNKHDEFEKSVLDLASSFSEVNATEHPQRVDLRALPFCTIDPPTAKDFDDAIFWDEKAYTLYVAIADVSYYVTPFGAIDLEAIYRSFSIYLPHRSIPMLPRSLSETLCSLEPNVDRLAYVFKIELDPKSLEVKSSEVFEAIINSRHRFSYDEVDEIFASSEDLFGLKKLQKVTNRLKEKRLQEGYEFNSKELKLTLDENTNLLSTHYEVQTPSHALIEDCMLLANKEAAKRMSKGIFRVHEPPSQIKLQRLYEELAMIGLFVEIKDSTKETIDALQAKARELDLLNEVDELIIKSQMQARYSPYNLGHFGLGFASYTHFTSPIRRYSDLIVHRVLKALSAGDSIESSYVLRNIESLAISISLKEREASQVEHEYAKRKFARWAEKNIGETFKARISETGLIKKAIIEGEISGAEVELIAHEHIDLFEYVSVTISEVDIKRATIKATRVVDVQK
ncbi:MAG: ribonuclease R family protein [Sulfuricurvum sp.]